MGAARMTAVLKLPPPRELLAAAIAARDAARLALKDAATAVTRSEKMLSELKQAQDAGVERQIAEHVAGQVGDGTALDVLTLPPALAKRREAHEAACKRTATMEAAHAMLAAKVDAARQALQRDEHATGAHAC